MREFMRKARPWAAVLVVSVFLGACSDDEDPSGPAFTAESAEQTADAAEAVADPIAASAELNANMWNAFGALYGFGLVSPMLPFTTTDALQRPLLHRFERPSLRGLSGLSAASPQGVLLPEEVMGTTFAWDVVEERYVPTEMAGAPANGVRFLYYAIDPFTQYPAEPLNALGYLQLVDASTTTTPRLEIEAVRTAGNVKLADYFVQATMSGTTVTLDAEGFLTDGSDQVDFDIRFVETETETTFTEMGDITIENASAGASINADYTAIGSETTYDEEGTFTVEHGGNTAVFSFEASSDYPAETFDLAGSLRYNGREVVLFEQDENRIRPEFTRPDGSDLTATEVDALVRIWAAIGMTQLFAAEIIIPFYFLLMFSGI